MAGADVLRLSDLRVHFSTPRGTVRAVDGISLSIREGERFGLAGESGSGKSTVAFAVMGLIRPPGHIAGGSIQLGGRELVSLGDEQYRRIRLADVALIPQGAMNSLNPVRRVRDQFADSIRAHMNGGSDREVRLRMAELLRMVGLRERTADLYPHELSGGMKQRVCIALSISLQPRLIIADEPTSALDVVVQRQVMQTLRSVQERLGASVILIGHDMGLLAQFVDRLGIMLRGRLVEIGRVRDVFGDPLHPYTRMLIGSLPTLERRDLGRAVRVARDGRLQLMPGGSTALEEVRPEHWVAPFES